MQTEENTVRQLWPNKLITFCSEIPGILTEPAMACRLPPSSGTDLSPAYGPPCLHPPHIWACVWTPLGSRLLAVAPSCVITFCKLEELYRTGGRKPWWVKNSVLDQDVAKWAWEEGVVTKACAFPSILEVAMRLSVFLYWEGKVQCPSV